ncbi:ABC transporter substrate-binding protein [Labrys wisconsinensis]|uniref:Putrescine-binding periplasmic protein n=1 Tax=Labrys wisconsinensis TaxID=425677 RepID=A0ABU0JF31_9HYPH|nr:extracellular solute-binding protein [Labrys wisconsinensis]MDQ0471737.1 spermidine/putrescine transport system substrate-binding protein [Labrys wisconsinensis]
MRLFLKTAAAALAIAASAGIARADGELNIYNWGNYTSPEMIKKFEDTYKVKVTVTDYDSNDTALAKIKAGAHGFDIVVPSSNYVPIFLKEGLLLESRPDQMENFKNVDPRWVNVDFDPGRHYTVPWQWGTTGISINTELYKGDINTWAIIFDTPDELKGKINVVPEMSDVIAAALWYKGFPASCNSDKAQLKVVSDTLVAAKKNWLSMEYGTIEKYAKGDIGASIDWNGAAFRARLANPKIAYGYPKEGQAVWMDNAAIIKDARNVDNAKLFLNFIMAPENAAMLSAFARYANGIKGSEAFMPEDMKNAPEINMPATAKVEFLKTCPPEVTELYSKIWTNLTK